MFVIPTNSPIDAAIIATPFRTAMILDRLLFILRIIFSYLAACQVIFCSETKKTNSWALNRCGRSKDEQSQSNTLLILLLVFVS